MEGIAIMKKCLAALLSLALMLTLANESVTAKTSVNDTVDNMSATADVVIDEENCVSGEALATLTLGRGEDSPLIHEGFMKNDPKIHVKNVMSFGSAADLATTKNQRAALSEKALYVSYVSSNVYDTASLIETIQAYSHVTGVSANHRIKKMAATNDPLLADQWSLGGENFGADKTSTASIGWEPENASAASKNTPVIAVIDDGIDFSVEELKDKKWINTVPSLKGTYGYDFCNDDTDPSPTNDEDDHATAIAGVIAAETDNGIGIAGISQNVKLMSLKVFDTDNEANSGTEAVELAAYEYVYKAVSAGVNVVAANMSFGYEPSPRPMEQLDESLPLMNTIRTKLGILGVITVHSSGNDGAEITNNTYGTPFEYTSDYSLLVGSVNPDGVPSSFSNYGKDKIDLMAPGEQILTTTRAPVFLPDTYDNEKRTRLCQVYDSFDANKTKLMTYADLFETSQKTLEISHSDKDVRGSSKSGSEKITLNPSRRASHSAYNLYYDVTGSDLNIKNNIYYSLELCDADNAWDHLSSSLQKSESAGLFSINNRTYLKLDLRIALGDDFPASMGRSIFIDNLALSVANPDTSAFGKYDFVNGTSFSAPQVAAAIARLAVLFPEDNALTRKKKLLACVKPIDHLKSYCISGGTLDMTGFADTTGIHENDIRYPVTKIKLNKTKATLKVGKKLKLKATVAPTYATNPNVKWTVSKKAYASVTAKGVVKAKKKGRGHKVTVTATAKDGSKKKATCKITIK